MTRRQTRLWPRRWTWPHLSQLACTCFEGLGRIGLLFGAEYQSLITIGFIVQAKRPNPKPQASPTAAEQGSKGKTQVCDSDRRTD